jgi:hypothetical protein
MGEPHRGSISPNQLLKELLAFPMWTPETDGLTGGSGGRVGRASGSIGRATGGTAGRFAGGRAVGDYCLTDTKPVVKGVACVYCMVNRKIGA